MPDTTVKSLLRFQIRPTRLCGISDELRWLDRRVRSELRLGDNGPRALSLGQISLQLSQLRRDHFDACDICGEQTWIG
jgi:hypothetical protein